MNLSRFPRRRYTSGWTPIERLDRLSDMFGGPNLYVKRDDLLAGAAGGNKTRKLEFVIGEALKKGADTLITCGAIQSNHCRLTLSAANKENLRCILVLKETVLGTYNERAGGNNLLFHLLGAEKIYVIPSEVDWYAKMEGIAAELIQSGRKPYIIPEGASNEIGSLGYVACAQEILYQAYQSGIVVDHVICAASSAGTQAGLLTGFIAMNAGVSVIGINVARERVPQESIVFDLARKTAELIGMEGEIPKDAVICLDNYVGPGYALVYPELIDNVKLLAQTESLLLDPVYTGKAMTGMLSLVRKGFFKKDENVLFIHTGGLPALYMYTEAFI